MAKYAKTLTKDSFIEWVYEKSSLAFLSLKAIGSSWAKSQEDVENTILELLESSLKEINKGRKTTSAATGMLRVELTVTNEWEDSGEEVIYPELLINF